MVLLLQKEVAGEAAVVAGLLKQVEVQVEEAQRWELELEPEEGPVPVALSPAAPVFSCVLTPQRSARSAEVEEEEDKHLHLSDR